MRITIRIPTTASNCCSKHHPNSRYLDHVQQRRFAIAQFWLEEYNKSRPGWYVVNVTDTSRPWNDLFGRAMKVFDRIRLDDPTGKLADDATLALANAYFAEGKYFKADEYYTDLRKTFPSSEHQFTAHFVGLKAKLLIYEGPDYGGTVLDDAEKLIETVRRQFPSEAEQERDFLNRAYAETRYKKAEREYQTAAYFDQKAEYGRRETVLRGCCQPIRRYSIRRGGTHSHCGIRGTT